MEFDFHNHDYYIGSCEHRQRIPIFSTIRVLKGCDPDLRCKAGKQGCGRPLNNVRRVSPVRR